MAREEVMKGKNIRVGEVPGDLAGCMPGIGDLLARAGYPFRLLWPRVALYSRQLMIPAILNYVARVFFPDPGPVEILPVSIAVPPVIITGV